MRKDYGGLRRVEKRRGGETGDPLIHIEYFIELQEIISRTWHEKLISIMRFFSLLLSSVSLSLLSMIKIVITKLILIIDW